MDLGYILAYAPLLPLILVPLLPANAVQLTWQRLHVDPHPQVPRVWG